MFWKYFVKFDLNKIAKLCFSVILLSIIFSSSIEASAQPKRVLILYSEFKEVPSYQIIDQVLQEKMRSEKDLQLEIYTEYMDINRFPDEEHLAQLQDYYQRKYAHKKLDLVIGFRKAALDFLLKYGDNIFPGASIVFCSVNKRELLGITLPQTVTGIDIDLSYRETLVTALKFHPNTKHIWVVAGSAEYDRLALEDARQAFREFETKLQITYLTDMPLTDILQTLSHVENDSIVIHLPFSRDSTGNYFIPLDVCSMITRIIKVPSYTYYSTAISKGVVGGYMIDINALSNQLGEHALRVLRGEKVENIPAQKANLQRYIFDWRELQRWNINSQSLPPNSEIRFRQLSVWELYGKYISLSIAIFILQSLFVIVLLIERKRRRRVERLLDERLRFEALLTNISAKFANISPDQIDKEIEHWLQQLTEFLNADRSSLVCLSDDETELCISHSYTRPGFAPAPSVLKQNEIPWLIEQYRKEVKIRLANISEDLPSEASSDRNYLQQNGIKSLFTLPLSIEGKIICMIVFVSIRKNLELSEELIPRLQLAGEFFANAIFRARALMEKRETTRALRASEQQYEGLVNSLDGIVWEADGNSLKLTFVSKQAERLLGYPIEQWLTEPDFWLNHIHPDDRQWAEKFSRKAIEKRENFQFEYRMIASDGRIVWIKDNVTVINEDNQVVLRGVLVDITDLKMAGEQLRSLSTSLQLAKEEESTRIARELHDELGSTLTSFKWDLETLTNTFLDQKVPISNEILNKLNNMEKMINTTINSVRRISTELRPSVLDNLGLIEAIEWQAQEFQKRTGIKCHFDCMIETSSFDEHQSTAIFRIMQEALTNILRHSRATRVNITMEMDNDEFILTIQDNGRGITKNEEKQLKSVGLLGMKERARLMGGFIEIIGEPYKGTTVKLRLLIPTPTLK